MMYSVLLSVYHKENPHFLKQALESVYVQTYPPSEVVLVEDGALTESLEMIVAEFQATKKNLKVVKLLYNQGLGKALNEGLKHCSCEIVARMDTDDVAKPNRFEKQLTVFENNSDIDVVGAWIDEFENEVQNVISIKRLPECHDDIFAYAKKRCPINHPVVMFKKKAVVDAGGYMHLHLFEDYYLWVRMLMNGAKFYNIQESLLYFRFSTSVFKRRGGYKYALSEIRLQREMKNVGFISWRRFIINVVMRFSVRLAPNSLRSFFYKKVLR